MRSKKMSRSKSKSLSRRRRVRRAPEKSKSKSRFTSRRRRAPAKSKSRRSRSSSGRGSVTRGWAKAAPSRGRARHALKSKCGSKCFLDPVNEKFPICAKLTGRKSSGSCEIDCRGVKAAYIRARQWGYDDIARKADRLYKLHC